MVIINNKEGDVLANYDGSLIFDTGIDNSGFSKGISTLEIAAGNAIGNIAANMIQQISDVVAQIPAQMVTVGSSFEASMSQVAATMGITSAAEEFETLSAAAKEMGEATKFSASQAGEALNYLALAGYDAEKAVNALPTVLNVAAAGGMELAAASDMVTDAMSALGLETSQMSDFSDKLAVTAQKSNTSVSQLGEAILTVGGTAKNLAGGVTEMNSVLGILADNGIKGAEGGTALRNIILSLTAPTNTAAQAIDDLGISVFDNEGKMRSLQDIIYDLNDALSTMTDADKSQALSEIFNKVDLKSINALLGTSMERFDELSGYIDNCSGAAADMAKTMDDNLKGDLTIMQSALEGLGIAAYEKFQTPMRNAVQSVTADIGTLSTSLSSGELSESFNKVSNSFSNMVTELGKLLSNDVVPAIINGFTLIIDNGNQIISIVAGIGAGFAAWKISSILLGVVQSIQMANVDLALLAMQSGNAAVSQMALAGGLTASEMAAGLFSGKISIATAAQAAFNAVCSINPLILIATGIAAVTTGAILLAKELKNASDSTNEYAEAMKQVQESNSKIADSSNTEIALIKKKEERYEELRSKIDTLNKNEMAEFLDLADDLKTALPEGTEIIDEQTGAYNSLADSIDKVIEKMRIQAILNQKQAEYELAVTQNYEIDDKLAELEEQRTLYNNPTDSNNADPEGLSNGMSENDYLNYISKKMYGISYDDLKKTKEYNEKIIAEYDDIVKSQYSFDSSSENSSASVTEMQAKETADKIAAANQTAAEDLLEKQKENTENLKAGWEQVEHDYAIGNIASEQELYARKRDLWNTYGDESLKDHWSYYEDLCKYDKDFAEESAKARKEANDKAAEDAIAARQEEWDSIERLNNLGIMSDEKAAKARQEFIDKYYPELNGDDPKITAENYQYAKQVLDDNTRLAKAALDEQNKVVDDGLSAILKSYQQAYDELDKKRENYRRKLLSIGGDVFSVDVTKDKDGNETTTYTVNNIDEQLKSMHEFHNQVKALKERDISDGLLEEMLSLDSDDSMQFAKYLSSMSAEEFAKINDLYKERDQIANDLSADLYADEAKEISDSMTAALAALATSAYDYGATTAQQFSAGFSAAINELGLGVLYNQITAAGATKTYENYVTENNTGNNELTINVDVSGKSNVYLDGKVVGESVTEYQGKQKKQTGT